MPGPWALGPKGQWVPKGPMVSKAPGSPRPKGTQCPMVLKAHGSPRPNGSPRANGPHGPMGLNCPP